MLLFLGELMNGILLINKEKGMTSRDVVNIICKKLNTTKVGHTGTLDPIATGLMVICVGEGLKLVELLTGHDKEYVAKVKMGIKTDTYDITGNILEENYDYNITKERLVNVLNSFKGEYDQVVPLYSSIKVNGKKLYEYARNKEYVVLPHHVVKIYNISLLELNQDYFTFKVSVSSGTYIRSLINDIGNKLNVLMTMEELTRTKVVNFNLNDATNLDDLRFVSIEDSINIKKIEVDDSLYKKISNGVKIKNIYKEDMVMFIYNNKPVSIYKNNHGILSSYRKFNI